jgi:hypothetical protein
MKQLLYTQFKWMMADHPGQFISFTIYSRSQKMTSTARPIPRFNGAQNYVATDDLKLAVNAALTLQRPLLIKGEPGRSRHGAQSPAITMAHQIHHQGTTRLV